MPKVTVEQHPQKSIGDFMHSQMERAVRSGRGSRLHLFDAEKVHVDRRRRVNPPPCLTTMAVPNTPYLPLRWQDHPIPTNDHDIDLSFDRLCVRKL